MKRSLSKPLGRPNTQVALSLGTGSILLVGNACDDFTPATGDTDCCGCRRFSPFLNDLADHRDDERHPTRGLVQLRILGLLDEDSIDTQETSCYVLEDAASNDSNYETPCSSFPSDNFCSDTEDDDEAEDPIADTIRPEAPARPVPPPPRESSLGRRMRILRRTWSITKCSLERIRKRRTTGNECGNGQCANGEFQRRSSNEGRGYFGFKMRSGKGSTGGALSTFYLETDGARDLTEADPFSDRSAKFCTFDEEPLYQFYAAAAAGRVVYEADTEGYKRIEETTSLGETSLTEATFRCWTPRIKGSPSLEHLTIDERRLWEAKFEILTSEASYRNSLRVLVDEFLGDRELVCDALGPNERERLFGYVPGVLAASESLLAKLETLWKDDAMLRGLPEILLDYAQKSSGIYVAYCSNQVGVDAALRELRNGERGSKFIEAVARIEARPKCQSLSLYSFFMLPMQRVTRLPLLAGAVISRLRAGDGQERQHWERALSRLGRVVIDCNEGAREAGRLADMEMLERKLKYSPKIPPIALRDRFLIRRGSVARILAGSDADSRLTFGKKRRKVPLYLFLLTDHLLIAEPKLSTKEETYTVTDSCKRNFVELEKASEDTPFAGRNAMILTLLENYLGRRVEYVLTCESPTERERWLDAISPIQATILGESLYEAWDCPRVIALYPYAAAQPDELSLQPGDAINVLRKMSDGWYLGERLSDGERGWFPGNYTREIASEHARAKNLRQFRRTPSARSTSILRQQTKLASS